MLKQARLYANEVEFATMMRGHLKQSLRLDVESKENEPLLLEIRMERDGKPEKAEVSLHATYASYMNTGDLNMAINYLNGIIRSTVDIQLLGEEMGRVDTRDVFPALRDKDYVAAAAASMNLVTEETPFEGLSTVFLMDREGYSVLVTKEMVAHTPGLSEEALKQIAYRNMRRLGWDESGLQLPCPKRDSCWVETFISDDLPIEHQFVLPDLYKGKLPSEFLIAFPYRGAALMLRSGESMGTRKEAMALARKSVFMEVVRRSFLAMPGPNSPRIYHYSDGEYRYLTRAA